ncbi:MAG TPA: ABC transporter substrate-binding protein, partial [Saliniramus sp.]|nr:ABC transporter substrate-binding protein [Saliniramus sp.]
MPNIVLSSAVRSNVLQLQSIEKNQGVIQNRLASGLRVSSALDDPRNFFQAQGLNFRANDLARLQDNMGLAIQTVQAADQGI